MATKSKVANKFLVKQYEAEGLNTLSKRVQEMVNDSCRSYQVVGHEEDQAKDWRTGELLWEDDEKTVPKYRSKYDYVDIPIAEMDEDQFSRFTAYQNLMSMLEKLL